MAGESGYNTQTGNIVCRGVPDVILGKQVEVATNVKPGRLLKKGTTDAEIKVNDGCSAPVGFAGFEQASMNFKPEAITDSYTVDHTVPILRGRNFAVVARQAIGFVSYIGDLMFSWGASGEVAPGAFINGHAAVRIPFTNSATVEVSAKVVVDAGMVVHDVIAEATAAGAGGVTISVGFNETVGGGEVGGDADGFLKAEVLASNTRINHNPGPTTTGAQTIGAFLKTTEIKDANGTFTVQLVSSGKVGDGVAKTITYTTTNTTGLTGYIWLLMGGPGVQCVGRCGKGADSSSAAADVIVEADI